MKDRKLPKFLVLISVFITVQAMQGQTVFGTWKTIDDKTGTTKAIVEVYEKDGLLNARILQLLEKGRENAICIKCKGELKDKPVKGMHIMRNFKNNGDNEYRGTSLFDPENGTTYRGKVWLDDKNPDKLKVRGYIAFLYRTQIWHRVKEGD